jgi:yeast amino acid transporter
MAKQAEATSSNDVEKASVSDVQSPSHRLNSGREPSYEATTEVLPQGRWSRFVDTFRRDENQSITPNGAIGADGRVYDPKSAAIATATTALHRNLKSRHLQMIAIGGSIGKTPYMFAVYTH